MEKKIKVGISACLLGERVRYDGGHKFSQLCNDELADYFDYVPLCPEVGIGMGVPRKPIRLVDGGSKLRALGGENRELDVSQALQDYAGQQEAVLEDICGYIFMQNSPSCGLDTVKVYQADGQLRAENGRGIFAQALTEQLPLLPVEEAGRLEQPALRKAFIARVKAYSRVLCLRLNSPGGRHVRIHT